MANYLALAAVLLLAIGVGHAQTGGTTMAPMGCGNTPIAPNLGSKTEEVVGGSVAVPYSWPWQIEWCRHGDA